MSVVSPAEFERLIGSLDVGEFRELVAGVWAARGSETAVEGETVLVTGGPIRDRERILCVPRRRWGHAEFPATSARVDVIVAARDTGRLRTAAAELDARFVGPSDLREMILYAMDREAADRLFVSNFDRRIAVDAPVRETPARRSLGSRRSTIAIGLLLAVGVAWLLAGATGADELSPSRDHTSTPVWGPAGWTSLQESTPTETGKTDERRADESGAAPDRYPPGLGPSGVTDAAALATAHGRAIAGTSYDLLLIHRGSEDVLAPDREWVFSRQAIDRVAGSHYWRRVTGLELTADGTRSVVVYDDYADGTYNYRRVAHSTTPEYERALIPTGGGNGLFTAVSEAYVRRYLSTTESHVETFKASNRTMFRIVATGTPERLSWPVSEYRAVAIVDRRGLVYSLSVEYTRLNRERGPNRPLAGTPTASNATATAFSGGIVRFELVYRDVGETTLSAPPWYDEARNATDETTVDLWPTDPRWWTQPVGIDYREDR